MQPLIVGVAGPSSSGKSSIIKELTKNRSDIIRLRLDSYWNDKNTFPKAYGYTNWERPENLNFDLLYKNIKELKEGKSTRAPVCKKGQFDHLETLEPKPIIIVEGFLLFYDKRITKLLDLKIYVNVSKEISIQRKMDVGRPGSSEREYCVKVYWPEYRQYVKPFKEMSDLILDGTEDISKNAKLISSRLP